MSRPSVIEPLIGHGEKVSARSECDILPAGEEDTLKQVRQTRQLIRCRKPSCSSAGAESASRSSPGAESPSILGSEPSAHVCTPRPTKRQARWFVHGHGRDHKVPARAGHGASQVTSYQPGLHHKAPTRSRRPLSYSIETRSRRPLSHSIETSTSIVFPP